MTELGYDDDKMTVIIRLETCRNIVKVNKKV